MQQGIEHIRRHRRSRGHRLWLLATVVAAVFVPGASAGEMVASDASLDAQLSPDQVLGPFDYFVRVDALTDLIERGISRTRHQPTARALGEVEIGNFYVTGSIYRLDNFPAGPKSQAQGEVELGYEKRWGNFLIDVSGSYELADVNDQS